MITNLLWLMVQVLMLLATLLCILAVIWLGICLCKDIREEMEKGKKNEG